MKEGKEPCAAGETCLTACPPPQHSLALPQAAGLAIPAMPRSQGEGNAGHCWDRRSRQGRACQGTWVVIVINVDIAGNGRAGASSKCTEAGNEPHQFLRCQLFHGAAGRTGPRLLGRSCPQLAAGCKHTPHGQWVCPAACREKVLGGWKWPQPSEQGCG